MFSVLRQKELYLLSSVVEYHLYDTSTTPPIVSGGDTLSDFVTSFIVYTL